MIKIFTIPIAQISRKEGAKNFVKYAEEEKGHFFASTPNAEILLKAQKNPKLKKFLKSCVLNFPDSVSMQWAAEYQAKNWSKIRAVFELFFLPIRKKKWKTIPERVCGSDVFEDICEEASKKNLKIFLLGGLGGVAEKTKNNLEADYPEIQIVGVSEASPNDINIIEEINKSEAQIIFTAYGCPTQELWIVENLKHIPSARIAMGIGGTFDFYAGKIIRAPKSFQKLGLEWLWRLIKEPKRIGRILNAVVVFPFKILFAK